MPNVYFVVDNQTPVSILVQFFGYRGQRQIRYVAPVSGRSSPPRSRHSRWAGGGIPAADR